MCSILGIFDSRGGVDTLRALALKLSRRQRHRGPDWSGVYCENRALLVHERLAIVGVDTGAQPLVADGGNVALAVNGEIYNNEELERSLEEPYEFQTHSDCEVILPLYQQRGAEFLRAINGIFAFALYDRQSDRYLIARDPIGVVPLYLGRDGEGRLYVASEMKALIGVCDEIEDFPPGHYLDSEVGEPRSYWSPAWRDYGAVSGQPLDLTELRRRLEHAVERQLMSDVPYGVLLSGGLDSSVIAALAGRFSRRRVEAHGSEEAWWPRLHSFAIGLEASPDLAAARVASQAIGSVHHELHFTVQEGIDALPEVIHHLETFDVTTVRASTPMYLMARKIKAMGVKMVLSGEGADEIFGGYLYFHKAPGPRELHEETVRKLDKLHKYDCLRANKSMAAWGVEARVPFLDVEFLASAMSFDPEEKMIKDGRIEKHVLRTACSDLLPAKILWRQKEQFSDGVGYSWIDTLRTRAEERVSDGAFAEAGSRFPLVPPSTKEEYVYREIFEEHFPGTSPVSCVGTGPSIACSTPTALEWDSAFRDQADPSGRAVSGVHKAAGL